MHIPDGFLSTPVWATLNAVSVPAVGLLARRAQSAEWNMPLLGSMGAFIFAAQMVNFPVAAGTSTHLMGGALLAYTVGPAAAVLVMAAVLVIQALVFQDGGLLALGANIFNLAIASVVVAYVPAPLTRSPRLRPFAIFAGASLSVLASAALALQEIRISGIDLPTPVLHTGWLLFGASAIIEGLATAAIVGALERVHPGWIHVPRNRNGRLYLSIACTAAALGVAGIYLASSYPDNLERILSGASSGG